MLLKVKGEALKFISGLAVSYYRKKLFRVPGTGELGCYQDESVFQFLFVAR